MLPIEQCYGVIVVFKEEQPKFLILKQIKTNIDNWSFAKGHMEEGETPIETAMRELEEETGITKIKILDFPLIHEEYELSYTEGNKLKVNEYFIGFVDDKNVKIDEKEVSEYKWVTFKEALDIFYHESRNEVLKEAKNYLDNMVK
ncbi:MAG: NUDIX domain-containing protein [Candidatus Paceibacterota bacterium]|jgi:8-oxo-dGTP pyrophosphatase MutT (NUDIX family)